MLCVGDAFAPRVPAKRSKPVVGTAGAALDQPPKGEVEE